LVDDPNFHLLTIVAHSKVPISGNVSINDAVASPVPFVNPVVDIHSADAGAAGMASRATNMVSPNSALILVMSLFSRLFLLLWVEIAV
jgi:hypothetical protein